MGCDDGKHALVGRQADHSAWCIRSKALSTVMSYDVKYVWDLSKMRGNIEVDIFDIH